MATEIPKFSFLERLSENPSIAFGLDFFGKKVAQYTESAKSARESVKLDRFEPYKEQVNGVLERVSGLVEIAKVTVTERAEPYRPQLANLVEKTDNTVHKWIDLCEEKYPIVTEPPEVVGKAWTEKKELVIVSARKPLDPEFRAKSRKIAFDKYLEIVDPKVALVVDFLEAKIKPTRKAATKSESQYQYERALELGGAVGETFRVRTTDYYREFKEKNAYAKKAAESAGTASETVSALLPVALERFSLVSAKLVEGFARVKEITEPALLRGKERAAEKTPVQLKLAGEILSKVFTPILADLIDIRDTEEVSRKEKVLEFWRRVKEDHAPRIKKEHVDPAVEVAQKRFPEVKDVLLRESTLLAERGKASYAAFKAPPKA